MHSLVAICGIAGAIGIAAGVGLLITARRMQHECIVLRRWMFELDLIALLDRRQTIERLLYRHHRAFGAIVIVAAVASLVALWGLHDNPFATDMLREMLGAWGDGAAILTSWALALFALGIGVFLFVRPSALKGFEAVANRWVEPFSSSSKDKLPVESGVNWLILRAPRVAGLLIFAAGLSCLLAFAGECFF